MTKQTGKHKTGCAECDKRGLSDCVHKYAPKQAQGHTPTPWQETEDNDSYSVTGIDGEMIADINTTLDKKRWEYNAAFIVRACNAHEKLVEALEQLCHGERVDRRDYENAEAALKLAKGVGGFQ